MKFISICSGIEAASVAFGPLGWKAVAFSEIEPFPCAVLAHHYPDVPNMGDMSKFREWPDELFAEADAIVGGPPCQAFSVAGLRNGLNDDRGNLTLTYAEMINHADAIRSLHGKPPVIVLYENVPGLLSDKTGAYGCFLAALAGEAVALEPPGSRWTDAGCVFGPKRAIAWRVLDAQYFALAQRRRRVFVVADFGRGADPAAVLFERESVRGNPAPSREARKDVAPTISARTKGGGGLGTDFDLDGPDGVGVQADIAYTLEARAEVQAVSVTGEISHTLKAEGFDASEDGTGRGNPIIAFQNHGSNVEVGEHTTGTLLQNSDRASGSGPCIVQTVALRGREGGATAELGGEVATALRASQGGGDKPHILAFSSKDYGADAGELSPTLRAGGHTDSHANAGVPPAIAFQSKASHHQSMNPDTISPSLQVGKSDGVAAFYGSAVRRLTPKECERLQGFPDGYTKISDKTADGPRYKALGNSMAVPVMRWIGERIERFMPREEAPVRRRLHFRADGRMELV